MSRWSTGRKSRTSYTTLMKNKDASCGAGLLNIDKPRGLTSHDVVARVRRLTRCPRVGHAGTLDPQAAGVLLICLAKGTKITQFLHELPKTYLATLQLGIRTDTQDATGKVVAVRAVGTLEPEYVGAVLSRFQGSIEQIPPMYSALKRQGRRLYVLARQGIEVDRHPRRVQIHRLTLQRMTAETLTLEVECSSGTYIRVLADDIGEELGCGAHLAELTRTAVGPFTWGTAVTLDALQEFVRGGVWQSHIIPLAEGLAVFPAIVVTSVAAQALVRGISPTVQEISQVAGSFNAGETVTIRGPDGTLIAVGVARMCLAQVRQVPPTTAAVQLRRVLVDNP